MQHYKVLFEVPCNIILKHTTPKLWFPTLMLAWGGDSEYADGRIAKPRWLFGCSFFCGYD